MDHSKIANRTLLPSCSPREITEMWGWSCICSVLSPVVKYSLIEAIDLYWGHLNMLFALQTFCIMLHLVVCVYNHGRNMFLISVFSLEPKYSGFKSNLQLALQPTPYCLCSVLLRSEIGFFGFGFGFWFCLFIYFSLQFLVFEDRVSL